MRLDAANLRDGELFLRLTGLRAADPERDWLPAWYFDICLDGGASVGRCELRVGFNPGVYYSGNVGYLVHAPWRGRRYAARACALLLKLARRQGMERLYITCAPENAASARTCEICGGEFLETAAVPETHAMYARGQRRVRVYRFGL